MKKSNRLKSSAPALATRDDAEAALNDLALAMTAQRQQIAQRDAQVLAINETYAPALAKYDQTITHLQTQLRAWADANPSEFPKDRKSLQMTAGTIGYRTGTPKLALLSRAWTWEKVLGLVRTWLPRYVRTKYEIDKESILANRTWLSSQNLPISLSQVGLRVTQDESFFIEPDLTQFESRQTVPPLKS